MPIVVRAVQRTSVLQVNRKPHLPLWVEQRVTPVQRVRPVPMRQKVRQVVAIVRPVNIQIPQVKAVVQRVVPDTITAARVTPDVLIAVQDITVPAEQTARLVRQVRLRLLLMQRHQVHVKHVLPEHILQPEQEVVQLVQPDTITPQQVIPDVLTAVQVTIVRAVQVVRLAVREHIQQPPMQHRQVHVRHVQPERITAVPVKALVQIVQPERLLRQVQRVVRHVLIIHTLPITEQAVVQAVEAIM